jgi:hypothetical protein
LRGQQTRQVAKKLFELSSSWKATINDLRASQISIRENPVMTATISDADIVSEIEKNVSTSAVVSELRNPKNETSNLALPDEGLRLHRIYTFRNPCLSAS